MNTKLFKRSKLPLEAFGLAPDKEQKPTDLIQHSVWQEIFACPDHTAIRTSEHNGTKIKVLVELQNVMIDLMTEEMEKDSRLFYLIPSILDDLQSALFTSVSGYYQTSASSLRSALDQTVIAAYLILITKDEEFEKYRNGEKELKFGYASDILPKNSKINKIETYLLRKCGINFFRQKKKEKPNSEGIVRWLFDKLSKASHGKPGHTHIEKWDGSNGPIYIWESFNDCFEYQLLCFAIFFFLMKICDPNMSWRAEFESFNSIENIKFKLLVSCSLEHLFQIRHEYNY